MAYFPNGSSGDHYLAKWCERCVNWRPMEDCPDVWGCYVWDLHILFDYDQLGKDEVSKLYNKVLEHFIPTGKDHYPEKCRMFIEKEDVDIPGQMNFLKGESNE